MTLRPELKTWRILNAVHGGILQAVTAADEEDLNGLVGMQIREAGLYMAAALATLELHRDSDDPTLPTPATIMPFTIHEVDALVAVLSGAVQRVPTEARVVSDLLGGLRQRFIEHAEQMRRDAGLPI